MTIIRVGTLIDGTGAPPVRDAVVTFEPDAKRNQQTPKLGERIADRGARR